LKMLWMGQNYELVNSKDFWTACRSSKIQEKASSAGTTTAVVRDTH